MVALNYEGYVPNRSVTIHIMTFEQSLLCRSRSLDLLNVKLSDIACQIHRPLTRTKDYLNAIVLFFLCYFAVHTFILSNSIEGNLQIDE